MLGVGTRWSDFTTASRVAVRRATRASSTSTSPPIDSIKHAGLPLLADARLGLEALTEALDGSTLGRRPRNDLGRDGRARLHASATSHPAQGEVIGVVNRVSGPRDVVVCAAGSMPGDLHKLWRTRDPKGYHVEYGYSTMGYEIAGGLGVKMAAPDREVFVLVGDGSYLMMAQELVTAVAEGIKLTVVLVQNHGYQSIGALRESRRLAALRHEVPLPRRRTSVLPGRPRRQRRQPRRGRPRASPRSTTSRPRCARPPPRRARPSCRSRPTR